MFALSNRAPGTAHYLDTTTGEVIPLFVFNREKVLEMVMSEPKRYVRLAPQPGAEGFRVMQEFIKTVSRPALREELTSAISGERAFARFRRAIKAHQTEHRRWLQFQGMMTARVLCERLREHGIELRLVADDQ